MLLLYFILMHVYEWLCLRTCRYERMCDLLYLDHISQSITHFLTKTHGLVPLTTVHKTCHHISISRPKIHLYAHFSSLQSYAYGMHPYAYGWKSTCSKWAKIQGPCSLDSKKCVCEILKHFENFHFTHTCMGPYPYAYEWFSKFLDCNRTS